MTPTPTWTADIDKLVIVQVPMINSPLLGLLLVFIFVFVGIRVFFRFVEFIKP